MITPLVGSTAAYEPGKSERNRALRHYGASIAPLRLGPLRAGARGARTRRIVAVAALVLTALAFMAARRNAGRRSCSALRWPCCFCRWCRLCSCRSPIAVSISQARRLAIFYPYAFAFAGGLGILAGLLRRFVLAFALIAGIALQVIWPGNFGYHLGSGGGAGWIVWTVLLATAAALVCFFLSPAADFDEGPGSAVVFAAALFVLPVVMAGFFHWSPTVTRISTRCRRRWMRTMRERAAGARDRPGQSDDQLPGGRLRTGLHRHRPAGERRRQRAQPPLQAPQEGHGFPGRRRLRLRRRLQARLDPARQEREVIGWRAKMKLKPAYERRPLLPSTGLPRRHTAARTRVSDRSRARTIRPVTAAITTRVSRRTDLLLLISLFAATFEKLHWEVGVSVSLADLLAGVYLISFAATVIVSRDLEAPRTAASDACFQRRLSRLLPGRFLQHRDHAGAGAVRQGDDEAGRPPALPDRRGDSPERPLAAFLLERLGAFVAGMAANAALRHRPAQRGRGGTQPRQALARSDHRRRRLDQRLRCGRRSERLSPERAHRRSQSPRRDADRAAL